MTDEILPITPEEIIEAKPLLYERYESLTMRPATYPSGGRRYETKDYQIWENRYIHSIDRDIQLEKVVADKVRERHIIYTLIETDEMCVHKDGIFVRGKTGRSIIRAEIAKIAREIDKYNETISKKNMIIETIKSETFISIEKFGVNPNIICVENGIIDINKKKFIKYENLKEPIKTFTKIPVKYDPKAKCPEIDKFLLKTLGESQIKLIYEMFGYCIQPTIKYQKAFMLQGIPNTGKTQLLYILYQLIGIHNISGKELQGIGRTFQMANLRDMMVNIGDDLKTTPIKYTSNFNKIVTNKFLSGEIKNVQGDVDWINFCKLVFACNIYPKVLNPIPGFWRRWVLIEFLNVVKREEIIRNYGEKITTPEELSGLLNKCIQGIYRLKKRNGFDKKFDDEEYIKERWNEDINPVRRFAREKCITGYSSDIYIDCKEFREKINVFRKARGYPSISQNICTRNLKKIYKLIERKPVNLTAHPESCGYKYIHIRWKKAFEGVKIEPIKKEEKAEKSKEKKEEIKVKEIEEDTEPSFIKEFSKEMGIKEKKK